MVGGQLRRRGRRCCRRRGRRGRRGVHRKRLGERWSGGGGVGGNGGERCYYYYPADIYFYDKRPGGRREAHADMKFD